MYYVAQYAWNIVLTKVVGKWLWVVDADDYFAGNALTL